VFSVPYDEQQCSHRRAKDMLVVSGITENYNAETFATCSAELQRISEHAT